MILNIYSVKDKKIGYMNTWFCINDNAAKRNFDDAINDSRSELNRHPYDMELWKVGTWNDATAEIISKVEYLASGADYYKEKTTIQEKGETDGE